MELFRDISYAQGEYNMAGNTDQMVMMKASGGDDGLYLDAQLVRNYSNATNAGKIPFMYHLAGNGDPTTEANYFIEAISPITNGDGYALDLEPSNSWTPAQVLTFLTRVHAVTGCWPWTYMDISRCNSGGWSEVFAVSGLWIAAPSYPFTDTVPINNVYIAQQGAIEGGTDTDMFFGSLEGLKEYTHGYVKPTPTPVPPAPIPEPTPVPPTPPADSSPPSPDPQPIQDVLPPPAPSPSTTPAPVAQSINTGSTTTTTIYTASKPVVVTTPVKRSLWQEILIWLHLSKG